MFEETNHNVEVIEFTIKLQIFNKSCIQDPVKPIFFLILSFLILLY